MSAIEMAEQIPVLQESEDRTNENANDSPDDDKQDTKDGKQANVVHTCSTCNRSFSSRREVVTHQYMHRENSTAFCTVCNKAFVSEMAYRRHAATHSRNTASTSRTARKTCSLCNMQFDSARRLSAHHAAKHVDEKRFACAICGSQFAWPENLRAHQRTHELDPHECELCGRRFVDATSLRVHTRNTHGPGSETPTPRKQFSCKLCGRTFQFDFSLRAHMKGHAQSPVAASLRRGKHLVGSVFGCAAHSVHIDNNGVTEQTTATERDVSDKLCADQESSVPVTNEAQAGASAPAATLDFSDVLDKSSTPEQISQLSESTSETGDNMTSKLLWYVKPDGRDDGESAQVQVLSEASEAPVQDTENKLQQQTAASTATVVCSELSNEEVNVATATAVAVGTDCPLQSAAASDDDDDDDDAGDASSEPAAEHETVTELSRTESRPLAQDSGAVMKTVSTEEDDQEEDDEEEDEIDWMLTEPPRKRAAPFIFRSASALRRRVTRPREPFLFNCVMTDEKPFHCSTCGQCFRWEISLVIHRRLHTDGTFPNKSRRPRSLVSQPSEPQKRGRAKRGSSGVTRVCRSRIVQARHSSSDEDDDEFTFHVHADGPSEVPHSAGGRAPRLKTGLRLRAPRGKTTLSSSRQSVPVKTRMRYNGGGRSPGQRKHDGKPVRSAKAKPALIPYAKPSCHGRAGAVSIQFKQRFRAGLVCRQCQCVVTSSALLCSHRRRMHRTTLLSCQRCSERFKTQLDLRCHSVLLHSTGRRKAGSVKCERCGRVLSSAMRLQQHDNLHRAAVKPHGVRHAYDTC